MIDDLVKQILVCCYSMIEIVFADKLIQIIFSTYMIVSLKDLLVREYEIARR
jgi:hypothetical protein